MSTPPGTYTTSLFSSLKVNNATPQTLTWLTSILYALDNKDVDAYCSYMSPTVAVTFNNGITLDDNSHKPNLAGIEATKAGLAQFWQSYKSLRHEEIAIFEAGSTLIHEALNHYETLDGRKVALRAVAVLERDEQGRIEALRIYSDQGALFAK